MVDQEKVTMPLDEFFIPTLHTFAMDNVFTGSHGDFRFKITPNIQKKTPKEVDFEKSTKMDSCCSLGACCSTLVTAILH